MRRTTGKPGDYDEYVSGYVAPDVQRRFATQAIQDAGTLAEETPKPR